MKKCSDIIADLYNGKNFNECLSKMEPEHLREDLKQEVILVICELPEEKINGMHERKELEFYAVRVILNMIRNPDNQFAKAFMRYTGELTGQEERKDSHGLEIIKQRHDREVKGEKILKLIKTTRKDDLKWYHKELLKIYMEKGNYREVASDTLIPFTSVFKAITDYKNSLKEIATKPIYTQIQAAKILKVSCVTMQNWERKKIIKPEVRGQGFRLVYTKSEIERVQAMRANLSNSMFKGNSSTKALVDNLTDEEINRLPPLNAKIVRLYKQLGSLRKVGKQTGFHHVSCDRLIKEAIEIIIKGKVEKQQLLDQPSLNHLNLMNTLEYLNQKNVS